MKHADRWYNRIVRDSRHSDKKKKRTNYEEADFIDADRLLELQNEQENKCYYCFEALNWMERRSSKQGLTVERLDDFLPHIKSNCVLACKSCNSARFTHKRGLLKRYFSMWKKRTFNVCPYVEDGRTPSFF